MRILSLSLDTTVCTETSRTAKRVIEYGALVDAYHVIGLDNHDQKKQLSSNVFGYTVSTARGKIRALIAMYKKAQALCVHEKFDIITVQDTSFLALLGVVLSKKYQVGLEIQVHGFENETLLRRLLAYITLPRAHSVRVVSKRLRKLVTGTYRVKDERITQVPIYVEPFSCEKKTKTPNTLTFLTVGRLVPVKRIALQIVAFKKVLQKYTDVQLRIVGSGPELESLRALVALHHLEEYVSFVGSVQDMQHEYCSADAFLLSSEAEGWGMSVIEAAYAGVPIIMSNVGCAGEVIVNNASGMVLQNPTSDSLAQAMIRMYENTSLRAELIMGAHKAVEKLPNNEETMQLYMQSWKRAAQA